MNSMNAILSSLPLLLLSLCLISGDESSSICSATNGETLHYTIRSRKNVTNHRIVSVDLRRDSVPNKQHNASADIDMEVDHTYLQCGGKERIMMSAVASTMGSAPRGDYELFPGLGFYKLHTKAEDWVTARSICVREGGDLTVINSDAETEVVKTFFSRNPKFEGAGSDDYIFVGVHDSVKEGQYMAVTGEPLDKTGYSRWAPSEPDGSTGQNYVVIKKNGLLCDVYNHVKLAFSCEQ